MLRSRIILAARLAWAAYTARPWAVLADIAILAALVAAITWWVA